MREMYLALRGCTLSALLVGLTAFVASNANAENLRSDMPRDAGSNNGDPSVKWFSRDRPTPAQFVLPPDAIACEVIRATALEPILFIAQRQGGNSALSVKFRSEENVVNLELSIGQIFNAIFYRTAAPNLPASLQARGDKGNIDTQMANIPIGKATHVMLCRRQANLYLGYFFENK